MMLRTEVEKRLSTSMARRWSEKMRVDDGEGVIM